MLELRRVVGEEDPRAAWGRGGTAVSVLAPRELRGTGSQDGFMTFPPTNGVIVASGTREAQPQPARGKPQLCTMLQVLEPVDWQHGRKRPPRRRRGALCHEALRTEPGLGMPALTWARPCPLPRSPSVLAFVRDRRGESGSGRVGGGTDPESSEGGRDHLWGAVSSTLGGPEAQSQPPWNGPQSLLGRHSWL